MNFKDNKMIIVGGIVLLFVILGGIFFLRGRSTPETTPTDTDQSQSIPKLSKEELDLSMELSSNNKQVKFMIGKASDIKSIEYEITYDADSTEDESVKVPKGITGTEEVDGDSYESKFLDMGTCSRNVCKYDTGIENIQLLLKITKDDDKVYQAEDSVEIEE